MLKQLGKVGIKAMYPGGRAVKLFKSSAQINNSTNLAVLGKDIGRSIAYICLPPPLRLAAECGFALTSLIAFVCSPSFGTSGAFLHVVGELYKKRYS